MINELMNGHCFVPRLCAPVNRHINKFAENRMVMRTHRRQINSMRCATATKAPLSVAITAHAGHNTEANFQTTLGVSASLMTARNCGVTITIITANCVSAGRLH